MSSVRHNHTYKLFNHQIHKIGERCRNISFPGAKGLSFYEVVTLYFRGLIKGSLNIRATSIAFHFMLALGPAIIFLLGLIPYLPFRNFQVGLMDVLEDMIPGNSYIMLESLLTEIFNKHHGLQIFGFLVTLFFVQKGVNGIIEAFNATYHAVGSRTWIDRHMIAVVLCGILFILVTLSSMLLFFSNMAVKNLYLTGVIKGSATVSLLFAGKWLIVLALTFTSISFLYYLAPTPRSKWRLFTPGSVFAIILSILTSIVVSYFINHFAPFDRFYGSIGTFIAVMLWMNFNSIALLAGFELNASIKDARINKLEPSVI
jgi:membrane protein